LVIYVYHQTFFFFSVSSAVETYSLVQDIDPPTDCAPKEITFRPEFPKHLKLRCLPFGSGKNKHCFFPKVNFVLLDEPKVVLTKSKIKKKRKRLDD
jgi:hypothetical protein